MRFFNSITRVLLVFAVAIVAFPAQDALANPLKKTVTNIAKAYSGYVVGNIIAPPKPPISPILKFDKRIIIEAVGLYCRFSLSYRDVSEILRHRGIQINPTTQKYNLK